MASNNQQVEIQTSDILDISNRNNQTTLIKFNSIQLNKDKSKCKPITCRVPLGSNFGPCLFQLYMIEQAISHPVDNLRIFADDTHHIFNDKKVVNTKKRPNHNKQTVLVFQCDVIRRMPHSLSADFVLKLGEEYRNENSCPVHPN